MTIFGTNGRVDAGRPEVALVVAKGTSKDTEQTANHTKTGMIPDAKNLYEGEPDRRGRSTWVDKYPDDLEEAAENAESARYALLIRNKKCYDGRKKLEIDSVVIQSPLLKQVLGSVLEDYPGVTTTLDRLTFKSPFEPFVHRWGRMVKAVEQEDDAETKAHLELLHKTLAAELEDDIKARDDFIVNGVITYEHIWMIFEPGSVIFTSENNHHCAIRLKDGQYVKTCRGPAYRLTCENVDWDGENFGLGSQTSQIYAFQGTKPITRLSAYPFEYHPDMDEVKERLTRRGKMFERLHGYHYKSYQGIAIGQGTWGPVKYNVDSRIVIDTYAWNRFQPNRQISLSTLNEKPPKLVIDSDDSANEYGSDEEYEVADVGDSDANHLTCLTKEQLLLCSPSLYGYSLKNKKWLEFFVDHVSDIRWNAGAFESLVLPEDHKELILALASSQVTHKESFDDVIQGKGKGMIMLLSGPPGVGKTLTAESVAEAMRAPLYMMSAGDLGLESHSVESALSNVLEMSTKWNAVLLLDEADVFLEQRSAHDLERNKLVSIFLRMLEYYEGILFLTTNRVENMDAAFQSRIHLSMQYDDLSAASRAHVWTNFLAAPGMRGHGIGEHDVDDLAKIEMNGRQIKNVLKTAGLLAQRKWEALGVGHVRTVLGIENRGAKRMGSAGA